MRLKGLLIGLFLVLTGAGCGSEVPDAAQQPLATPAEVRDPAPGPGQPDVAPAENEPASALVVPANESDALDAESDPAPDSIMLAQADPAGQTTGRFQLGKQYQRLTPTQPTSSSPEQVEVAEVFWYGCSHCYNFDPYVEKWLTRKPDSVSFVRIPAVWNPLVKFHARAFYTAQALDKEQAMHTAFFREIHVSGNALDTEAKLVEFFGRFDVPSEEFSKAFNSFAVHTKLQQAETLARRYRVTSVPLVVVNGKYTTSASMTGGYDTLMEVIDELVAMESDAT